MEAWSMGILGGERQKLLDGKERILSGVSTFKSPPQIIMSSPPWGWEYIPLT